MIRLFLWTIYLAALALSIAALVFAAWVIFDKSVPFGVMFLVAGIAGTAAVALDLPPWRD